LIHGDDGLVAMVWLLWFAMALDSKVSPLPSDWHARIVSFPEPLVVVPAKTSDDGKARRLPGSKSPRACRAADYDSKNLLKVCNDKNNVRR
jgi:hypothetical protein